MVHTYSRGVTEIAWKKTRFIKAEWSDFNKVANLSISGQCFAYANADIAFCRWDIATELSELVNWF